MKNDPEGLGKGRAQVVVPLREGALEGEDEECAEPKVPSWGESPVGKCIYSPRLSRVGPAISSPFRVTRTVTGIEAMGVHEIGRGNTCGTKGSGQPRGATSLRAGQRNLVKAPTHQHRVHSWEVLAPAHLSSPESCFHTKPGRARTCGTNTAVLVAQNCPGFG